MTEVQYAALLARFAVRGQKMVDGYERRPALFDISDAEQAQLIEWADYQRVMIADVERALPDIHLCAAYRRTSGKPGDPEVDALLAELERRGLSV